jgi:nicotinate-nucleotide adenylyltransferase
MEMLRLAVEDAPGFEVSGMELRRSGPTLTVETLWEIREECGPDTELVFILGLDVLGRFDQWVEPGRVVELARLLAVSRPGYAGFDWPSFYARNPYADGRVDCIESTDIDISASELRRRLSNGQAVSGLLPEAVERYIRENGLYGGG